MKMIHNYSLIAIIIIILTQISFIHAQMHEIDYNNSLQNTPENQNLVVRVLKYDPYPVNAGEWFDLWLKIENVGQEDVKNAQFEFIPDYPFYSNDSLVRNYGRIYGTLNAYNVDQTSDSSQVIMKFRVKTADNAPEGTNIIKIKSTTDSLGGAVIYTLPIEVAKTKTDFDVVMQVSNSQGTSFGLSNIGENPANAVTVSLKDQPGIRISGAKSSIVGNLNAGDFTTVTYQINTLSMTSNRQMGNFTRQNLNNVTIEIAYTDIAGVRNIIDKQVPIDISMTNQTARSRSLSSTSGSIPWMYIILGVLIGALIMFFWRRSKHTKHETH